MMFVSVHRLPADCNWIPNIQLDNDLITAVAYCCLPHLITTSRRAAEEGRDRRGAAAAAAAARGERGARRRGRGRGAAGGRKGERWGRRRMGLGGNRREVGEKEPSSLGSLVLSKMLLVCTELSARCKETPSELQFCKGHLDYCCQYFAIHIHFFIAFAVHFCLFIVNQSKREDFCRFDWLSVYPPQ